MQQLLSPILTDTVDGTISRCSPRAQARLVEIDVALQAQQFYIAIGKPQKMLQMYRAAASALESMAETHSHRENEALGELWERAGKQLKNTMYLVEQYNCFLRAMDHYERANNDEKVLQAFRNLYGK